MRGLLTHPFWKGFLGALIAVLVALLGIHLYSDHVALHTLVTFLNQHAEQISKLP